MTNGEHYRLALFLIVSIPAKIKLLPLKYLTHASRTSYLQEILDPESEDYKNLDDNEKVDEIINKFSRQHFWPVGDPRAKERIWFALVVFLIILFPIAPISKDGISTPGVGAFATIIGIGYFTSGLLMKLHRYLLHRIDPSLVQSK